MKINHRGLLCVWRRLDIACEQKLMGVQSTLDDAVPPLSRRSNNICKQTRANQMLTVEILQMNVYSLNH